MEKEIPKTYKGCPVFFTKNVTDYDGGHSSRRNIKGFEINISKWKYREILDCYFRSSYPDIEPVNKEQTGSWKKLPEQFYLLEYSSVSSNAGNSTSVKLTLWNRNSKIGQVIYEKYEDSFPHAECKIACDGLCPYLYYDAPKEPNCCPHGFCLYKDEKGTPPNWLNTIIEEIF